MHSNHYQCNFLFSTKFATFQFDHCNTLRAPAASMARSADSVRVALRHEESLLLERFFTETSQKPSTADLMQLCEQIGRGDVFDVNRCRKWFSNRRAAKSGVRYRTQAAAANDDGNDEQGSGAAVAAAAAVETTSAKRERKPPAPYPPVPVSAKSSSSSSSSASAPPPKRMATSRMPVDSAPSASSSGASSLPPRLPSTSASSFYLRSSTSLAAASAAASAAMAMIREASARESAPPPPHHHTDWQLHATDDDDKDAQLEAARVHAIASLNELGRECLAAHLADGASARSFDAENRARQMGFPSARELVAAATRTTKGRDRT